MSYGLACLLVVGSYLAGSVAGWFGARKRYPDDEQCPMCGTPAASRPGADLDVTPVDLPRPRRDKMH